MIPACYLSPTGLRAVKARAAALRDYLRIRRNMREACAKWGAL